MLGMLTLRAPAKINLTLEVLARRGDGYHGIRSVMVPLELADELTIEPNARFSFACDRADLADDRNLALAALRMVGTLPAFASSCASESRCKPAWAADRAMPRRCCARRWRARSDRAARGLVERRARPWIRRSVLSRRHRRARRGNRRTRHAGGAMPRWHVLIVKPPVAISTAGAYARSTSANVRQRPRRGMRFDRDCSRRCSAAISQRLSRCCKTIFTIVIAAKRPKSPSPSRRFDGAGATNALLGGFGFVRLYDLPRSEENRAHRDRSRAGATYERYMTAFAATPDWRLRPSSEPVLSERSEAMGQDDVGLNAVVLAGGPQDDDRASTAGRSEQGLRRNRRGNAGRPRARGAARVDAHRANRRRRAAGDAGSSRFDARRRASPRRRAHHREPAQRPRGVRPGRRPADRRFRPARSHAARRRRFR